MHDPDVVAFEIPLPLPRLAHWPLRNGVRNGVARHRRTNPANLGEPVYPWWRLRGYDVMFRGKRVMMRSFITVWHREPGGADSGTVCPHTHRWQDTAGRWHAKRVRAWRWHVHHWHLQWHGYQAARRWLLTRCEWCGGKSRKGDVINVSTRGWDAEQPARWWQGEQGVVHWDCSAIEHAHRTCTCPTPVLKAAYPGDQPDYGQCVACGRFRAWRRPGERDAWAPVTRWVQDNVPVGARFTAEQRATHKAMCAEAKAAEATASRG